MAFNTFTKYRDKGVFVYGLTDNGKIFYVGITDYIRFRYKQHFSDWLTCGKYIYQMRLKGEYPEVVLFGIFDYTDQAEAAEHSVIRCLSYLGNKLCNNHQNPHNNMIKQEAYFDTKPKRMPHLLAKSIIEKCISDYNKFRKWQPYPIQCAK
jgi:predicted GIY-YIG superfamily endonuclease